MLQFADDNLFFCEANIKSMFNLKVILYCFELASGLKVNFSKCRLGGVDCYSSVCDYSQLQSDENSVHLLGVVGWRVSQEKRV